jgi:hypothetical protein
MRPHRHGECPALIPPFERQVVEPFHEHHLRTDQPVIVKFEIPTAFAFVVQLKAGVPDQVDDRLRVEHRQLWLSFDDPDDRVIAVVTFAAALVVGTLAINSGSHLDIAAD